MAKAALLKNQTWGVAPVMHHETNLAQYERMIARRMNRMGEAMKFGQTAREGWCSERTVAPFEG